MSAALNPFGLRPIRHPSGLARATAFKDGIASGYSEYIYQYTPVTLGTSGVITIAAVNTDILGSFQGVEYTDANGRRQFSKMWTDDLVATEIVAYVWCDPLTIFEIQCDGSLAKTARGDQADFAATPQSGSTTTQLSTAKISSTLAGVGVQAQLRIMDLGKQVDNAWGDAYTIVEVQIARHQYVANKVAL